MKKIIFTIMLLFSFSTIAYAEEYYINNNNVYIPVEKYNYLQNYFAKTKLKYLTQEEYNQIKDQEFISLGKEETYHVTRKYIDSIGSELISDSQILTKEEYENFESIQTYAECSAEEAGDSMDCWITESKKLTVLATCNSDKTICGFGADVEWLKDPKVRSYDVLALRWEGDFTLDYFHAVQGSAAILDAVGYEMGGTNSKYTSNGVGISMNLLDEGTGLCMYSEITGTLSAGEQLTIYATYQHATSSLSLANSKSYSFSSSGLGKVLYYSNSTIRNKYDNMQGVKTTFMYL